MINQDEGLDVLGVLLMPAGEIAAYLTSVGLREIDIPWMTVAFGRQDVRDACLEYDVDGVCVYHSEVEPVLGAATAAGWSLTLRSVNDKCMGMKAWRKL